MKRWLLAVGCGMLSLGALSADPPERGKRGGDSQNRGGGAGERGQRGGPGMRGGPGGRQPSADMIRRINPLFAALDGDADGEISAEEISGASAALRKMDTDGNGLLTLQEMMPRGGMRGGPGSRGSGGRGPRDAGPGESMRGGKRGPGGPGESGRGDPERMKQMFSRADANGDGKLSIDEAPEMLKPRFDRVDADGDGSVTAEELRSAMEKYRGAGGRSKGGGRGDSERPGGDRPRRPAAE